MAYVFSALEQHYAQTIPVLVEASSETPALKLIFTMDLSSDIWLQLTEFQVASNNLK